MTEEAVEPTTSVSDCCAKVHFWVGDPKGQEIKVGNQDAYLATPPNPTATSQVVCLFSDAFGWKLVNTRLIADKLAEELGIPVYLPDFFAGDPAVINEAILKKAAARPKSIFDSAVAACAAVVAAPSMIRFAMAHPDRLCQPRCDEFLNSLKELKFEKIFGVGYCWGGRWVVKMAAQGKLDSYASAHPALNDIRDLDGLNRPGIVFSSEEDFLFSKSFRQKMAEKIKELGVEYEYHEYPDTFHGFATRGREDEEVVRNAREDVMNRTVAFFKTRMQ